VLYRHLRELFGRWGWLVSLILSLLTSSFLFAVIHPQGALGVPLLTAVAIVLALLREWRASLIAPIVTHMIVNGVTTTLVLLIFA
jgi:membrane protease YdiL (CAAX protease family)